jgi:hypothetical protein
MLPEFADVFAFGPHIGEPAAFRAGMVLCRQAMQAVTAVQAYFYH